MPNGPLICRALAELDNRATTKQIAKLIAEKLGKSFSSMYRDVQKTLHRCVDAGFLSVDDRDHYPPEPIGELNLCKQCRKVTNLFQGVRNENGVLLLEAMNEANKPMNCTQIVVLIANNFKIPPKDAVETVVDTLREGVALGFIRKCGKLFFTAEIEESQNKIVTAKVLALSKIATDAMEIDIGDEYVECSDSDPIDNPNEGAKRKLNDTSRKSSAGSLIRALLTGAGDN